MLVRALAFVERGSQIYASDATYSPNTKKNVPASLQRSRIRLLSNAHRDYTNTGTRTALNAIIEKGAPAMADYAST